MGAVFKWCPYLKIVFSGPAENIQTFISVEYVWEIDWGKLPCLTIFKTIRNLPELRESSGQKKKEKNAGFLPFCQLSLERCVLHKTLYHFLHFFVSHLKQKSSRHFNHTINAISNSGVHLRISTNIHQTSSFPFTWTEQLFRLTNKLW